MVEVSDAVSDGAQQGDATSFRNVDPSHECSAITLLQEGGLHHRHRVREKAVKEQEARQRLTENIELRQSAIKLFLRQERPRRNRLATTSVVGSALAAGFTAGPAFGGPKFAAGVQGALTLEQSSIVWQVLCLAAMLMSVVAAVSTNLANSHSVAAKVSAAEACNAQLEGLQTALNFGRLPLEDAIQLYQQYASQVAFVDDVEDKTTSPR